MVVLRKQLERSDDAKATRRDNRLAQGHKTCSTRCLSLSQHDPTKADALGWVQVPEESSEPSAFGRGQVERFVS